ncbi:MAG: hypothetical protein R3E51_07065 [Rhizobiaceae bacterium]
MVDFVIGSGEWILAKPKAFWRPNPPFVALKINFDSRTGTAETGTGIGRQPITSPLANLVAPTPTSFRANYTFGANNGKIEATIDDSRRLDVTFTGTLDTSVMAEPIRTGPPGRVTRALAELQQANRQFADAVMQEDPKTKREYLSNSDKYGTAILTEIKQKRLSQEEAVREIEALHRAVAGLLPGGRLLERMAQAAAEASAGAAAWGGKGTMTVIEAFGRPNLPDSAWVHFAPSQATQSIRGSGVTTTSHSSWARWGEIKNVTYGELVFRIGPMSQSSMSDLAVMGVAAESAPIREVKGLYGFKVEGAATETIRVQVIESGYARSLAEAQRAAGKTLTELEETFAARRFGEALRTRPGGAGKRLFERLAPTEQAQVRLDIVDSVNPNRATAKPPAAGRWAKIGRGLLVVAIAVSIYKVATAEDRMKQAAREAIGFAGGAAGGFVAGSALSSYAPNLSPIIIGLTTFVGGLLGALGADFVFEWLDSLGEGDVYEHF